MSWRRNFIILLLCLTSLLLAIFSFLFFVDLATISLDSPLAPIVLTTKQYIPINPIKRWQAQGTIESNLEPPQTESQSLLLLDFGQEKIIYEKGSEKKLPVASLSKLMTATVALQMGQENQLLAVSPEATASGEAAVGLRAGEQLTVEELLYGMLLVSGNETAEVLARNIPREGREQFISWMNQKAKNLDLEQTFFINPTGLDEDRLEVNTSSAGDLTALFYYLFKNFPLFRKIFITEEYVLEKTPTHQKYLLQNTAWEFTDDYPYLLGGKSGNTDRAGFCLLGLAKKGNHQLLLIILGEPDFDTLKKNVWALFDYGFGVLGQSP